MDSTHDIRDHPLAQAWEVLQAQHTQGEALQVDSNRLAFADPEFLLRRETRGIRFQLEMLKPDLAQQERGIEHTVVVFGSARFRSEQEAQAQLQQAQASGEASAIARAQTLQGFTNERRFTGPVRRAADFKVNALTFGLQRQRLCSRIYSRIDLAPHTIAFGQRHIQSLGHGTHHALNVRMGARL